MTWFFWPAKSASITESKGTKQIERQDRRYLQTQAKISSQYLNYTQTGKAREFLKRPPEWDRGQRQPEWERAQKQYGFTDKEEASFRYPSSSQADKAAQSPHRVFRRYYKQYNVPSEQMSFQYPSSSQPNKARKFPGGMPELYRRKHDGTNREISLPYSDKAKVKNPEELLRRLLEWSPERFNTTGKEIGIRYPRSSRTNKARELLSGTPKLHHVKSDVNEAESSEKLRRRLLEQYEKQFNITGEKTDTAD